jgi:hypothetical protein
MEFFALSITSSVIEFGQSISFEHFTHCRAFKVAVFSRPAKPLFVVPVNSYSFWGPFFPSL